MNKKAYDPKDMPEIPLISKRNYSKISKFKIPRDGYKVLVLPDLHIKTKNGGTDWIPDVSSSLWTALNFGNDFKPDMTILLGDVLELDMISYFTKRNLLAREEMRLSHDFELGNQVLNWIDKFTRGEKVYLFGNHELRLQKYVEERPELKGLLSIKDNLHLEERKWRFFDEGKIIKVGHACFTHGWYWNMYHSKKHVSEVSENIFYGHTHDLQCFTKPNPSQRPIIGQSLGCLCNLNPAWLRNKPNRWVNSLGIFYFSKSGDFTHYSPIIIDGCFWWAGKYFTPSGKK